MKHLTKQQRDRIVAVGIGTVMVLVLIWQGLIVPQQKHLATVLKRIAEQQTKNDNARRLIAAADELQQQLQQATAKLQDAEAGMASGDMYSWIIQTISKFREPYNVDIPQFSREVPCEVGLFPEFPYRAVLFNLRGTAYYHDLGRFVADFENRFPYLRVQNLELEPAAGSAANAPTKAEAPNAATKAESEKLAFRMEIVALVNPNSN
jgi:Tfp pilus assembly protein PilO